MTAIAWTLVALMAASLGLLATALFALLSRFDRLGSDLRAEMRDLRTDLRAEIREVTEAVHRLDVRLTSAGG